MQHHVFPQVDCGASASTLAGAYLRNRSDFLSEPVNERPSKHRSAVAAAMRRRYEELGLTAPDSLHELSHGAPVWTAGHQLVAAGGPAFFHYKILSMVRRARLQAEAPVVVFWLASEDHDWDEVRHFPSAEGRGSGFAWEADAPVGAVGRWPMAEGALRAVSDWADAVGLPPAWREGLEADYAGSATLAEATFRCVHRWLGADGVLVIDADDPELKRLAAPLWEAELAGDGIGPAVEAQTQFLAGKGWSPPLHPRDVALFELRPGGRVRLERANAAVRPVDGAWSMRPEEAAGAAVARAQDWSPNAALRPLYQEWLLGSEAVYLGPSELAYWLQLEGAFKRHRLAMPRLELRDGAVGLDPAQWDWLQGAGWHPSQGRAGVEERWRERCAEEAAAYLPQWDFAAWGDAFAEQVRPLEPTLEGAARAAVKKMEKAYEAAAAKVRRAWKAQHAEEDARVAALAHRLAPGQTPQERTDHVFPVAEAAGGWSAFKEAWLRVERDEPVFIVWVGAAR